MPIIAGKLNSFYDVNPTNGAAWNTTFIAMVSSCSDIQFQVAPERRWCSKVVD